MMNIPTMTSLISAGLLLSTAIVIPAIWLLYLDALLHG